FLEAEYDVRTLPTYDPQVASNPFVAFRDLPVSSRYRFLLDDAALFVMMFIKGPSCRGQVALDVIDDRFWIFFIDPDSALLERSAEFLARESKHLRLPAEGEASRLGLVSWVKYSRLQKEFLKAKQAYLEAHESVKEYVYGSRIQFEYDSGIAYRTDDPKSELFALLRQRLSGALNTAYDLGEEPDAELRTQLDALSRVRGRALVWLPEVAFVAVTDEAGADIREDRVYTLIHDNGFSNIASLMN